MEAQSLNVDILNIDSSIRIQEGSQQEILKIAEATLDVSDDSLTELNVTLEKNKHQLELILEDAKLILGYFK